MKANRIVRVPMTKGQRERLEDFVAANQPMTLSKLVRRVLKDRMANVSDGESTRGPIDHSVCAYVGTDDWTKLKSEANKQGLTFSSFARQILIEFLNEHTQEDRISGTGTDAWVDVYDQCTSG